MRLFRTLLCTLLLLATFCGAQVVDANLQAQPGWQSHEGGNIGGVAPKLYTMQQFPPAAATFSVQGSTVAGGYPDVDWYLTRPIQSNTGHLSLSYDLVLDGSVAANAQALERDTVLTIDGLTSNFSFQILTSSGWKLQISSANGGWVDTGCAIQPLAPEVTHHFLQIYSFDLAAKSYSYIGIAIDGYACLIPPSLQNLPMQGRGWGPGAIFQFQEDETPAAAGYHESLANAAFTWW